MPHTKMHPNIESCSEKKVDFIDFAILNISCHFKFSIWLNFDILKPCSQIKLPVKSDIHGCRGFRK